MHIESLAGSGAVMAHGDGSRETVFAEWGYGTALNDDPDPTHLVYRGDDPALAGTTIPLAGNADAQAFHVAWRRAVEGRADIDALMVAVEGAGGVWALDDAGGPPAPHDLAAHAPTPEAAAAIEEAARAEEERLAAERERARMDAEAGIDVAAIAARAVEEVLRARIAGGTAPPAPRPLLVLGAPLPPPPPDALDRIAAARAALRVPAPGDPPETPGDHPFIRQLRDFDHGRGPG